MENNAISQILIAALIITIVILLLLMVIFIILKTKEAKEKKAEKKEMIGEDPSLAKKTSSKAKNKHKDYTEHSIRQFLEFDKIEDNMIIQKNGKRFLMAIECQGVNYDLMSKMEKVAVEEGFQQFLNTLKSPIQIYIQTRSVNLENSIINYKEKVKEVKEKYDKTNFEYNMMRQNDDQYTKKEIDDKLMELTKNRNLLEYGQDIVTTTEKMSLNKNVLSRKYYIIVPHFSEEDDTFSKEEIKNTAFSELYTKTQALAGTIAACSVKCKILNSEELAELLYISYNREEAELFGIEKAVRAGYDELYATAQNVLEKKMSIIDETIERRAVDLANESISAVKSRLEQRVENKEKNIDDLIKNLAQTLVTENADVIGEEIAEESVKEIKKRGRKKKVVEGGNESDS